MPELSVVVPVYDNWWLTARCLRTLDALRSRGRVSFETIVVDNGSTDETPRAIASFPWVRYLRHETNRNFAGACNAGARLAQAPLTLLLNNDAYPLGDAFEPLVAAFERPEVAIAGGALFFEDGVTQAAGLVLLANAHWHYRCRNLPATLAAVQRARDALAVSGAAMTVRTDWFVESGFDESFVNGFEDVDLCLRALAEQRTIAYVPAARFAHYEAASAGRFDREAENERHFYARWATSLAALPRTARGETGAISVRAARDEEPLLAAARNDLEAALCAFGHPVVHGGIGAWRRLDRRFRRAAALTWFAGECPQPGIAIEDRGDRTATIRTRGAVTLEIPWLPCASLDRVARLGVRRARDPSCAVVGVVGGDEAARAVERCGYSAVRITAPMLLGEQSAEVACVAHFRLTDASAFGSVLLAQSGLPSVVPAAGPLRELFAPDVALLCEPGTLRDALALLLGDPGARDRYGALIAADARRRFSPRRSAIRVVDLLCAARFGFERPAAARSNTPLSR